MRECTKLRIVPDAKNDLSKDMLLAFLPGLVGYQGSYVQAGMQTFFRNEAVNGA